MSPKIIKFPHNNPAEQLSQDTLTDIRDKSEDFTSRYEEFLNKHGITLRDFRSRISEIVLRNKLAQIFIGKNYCDAADLEGDVVAHILNKINKGKFNPTDNFYGYVARIICNYMIDKRRKITDEELKYTYPIERDDPGDPSNMKIIEIVSKSKSPEDSAVITDVLESVRNEFLNIFRKIEPEEHRKAIELYFRYKLGDKEVLSRKSIAEKLNISQGSANALIETGLRRLNKALGEDEKMRTILTVLKILKVKKKNKKK